MDQLSVEELQQLLYRKRRSVRHQRWQRLKNAGRVVDVAGLSPPDPESIPPPRLSTAVGQPGDAQTAVETPPPAGQIQWRWAANKFLLSIEVLAVVGLLLILWRLWDTGRELNQELALIQEVEVQGVALPTPTATPVIDVVVLPSGHKPPIDGRLPEQGEAGFIPEHLLPAINAYVPPPIPTPGPQQARRIQIPAIDVDSLVVQGDSWEPLKKGVGQHIGSALPGQAGNMVLSAHNDIFGEIFRHLDKLTPGDEIMVSTDLTTYTYIVRDIEFVAPTDVWVMAPTEHASATLISCYPYRVNDKRIIIFADLVTDPNINS